ncbi:hypothetical protein BD410DRAFT_806226 [Rickenella mellea]|uniref:Uncharacterized protein n=1 Tax=Rickenella mellea TaxID=50990 RepID=A0A4Y7PUM2_9AGAM|nr:hypothetical protein BD410DRAFT_806226 [Rickenella mellea]
MSSGVVFVADATAQMDELEYADVVDVEVHAYVLWKSHAAGKDLSVQLLRARHNLRNPTLSSPKVAQPPPERHDQLSVFLLFVRRREEIAVVLVEEAESGPEDSATESERLIRMIPHEEGRKIETQVSYSSLPTSTERSTGDRCDTEFTVVLVLGKHFRPHQRLESSPIEYECDRGRDEKMTIRTRLSGEVPQIHVGETLERPASALTPNVQKFKTATCNFANPDYLGLTFTTRIAGIHVDEISVWKIVRVYLFLGRRSMLSHLDITYPGSSSTFVGVLPRKVNQLA